jgi:Putative Flp pilus-assembly TadE/G-like
MGPREPERETGRRLGGRGGQAIIIATLTLTFLFASVGLAWDLGLDYFLKTRVQTAADSAASAAMVYALKAGDSCSTITCGVTYTCAGVTPPTNSLQAGCLYATVDGPPVLTATMIENNAANPPAGLTGHTAPTMWIQATATSANNHYFLYLSGFHSSSILATAIAGSRTVPAGSCIYVLSPTASQALTITGTSSITTSSCGVAINSNAADALYLYGSPYLGATGGGQIKVNGGDSISVGGHALPDPSPSPLLHNGPVSDPLSGLAQPSYSGCTHNTSGGLTSSTANYSLDHSNTATMGPGVYCGGINVDGTAVLTLTPGTYIMNGGGFTVSHQGTVNATNVTIYNTAGTGQTAGGVSIVGNATVNLTAPTSGTYMGIAFFQDPALTNTATIANSATGVITGTYYFPSAAFNFTGNTATAVTAAFVASTMTIAGSSTLNADVTGSTTGLAANIAVLLQ